jgi:hypothetical protein
VAQVGLELKAAGQVLLQLQVDTALAEVAVTHLHQHLRQVDVALMVLLLLDTRFKEI